MLASHFFGVGVFYLLGLVTLSYALLAVSPGIRGSATAALVVSYNIGKLFLYERFSNWMMYKLNSGACQLVAKERLSYQLFSWAIKLYLILAFISMPFELAPFPFSYIRSQLCLSELPLLALRLCAP